MDPRRSDCSGETRWVNPARDAFEEALIREALRRELPILGVCRGAQLLNTVLGGSLKDLGRDPDLARTHGISLRSWQAHDVHFISGSCLQAAYGGAAQASVNSFHLQALDRLAPDLQVAALAPDGVIEAIELPGQHFVVGVQWHPELLTWRDPGAKALFQTFLKAARRQSRG